MKVFRGLAAAAAVVVLAGCEANKDPAQGGFYSGLVNLSNGGYDQRQQQRKETLENEQDVNVQKQRELERTNAQRDAVAAQRTQMEQKYAGLTADIQAMQTKIAKAKLQNSALQRQVDALKAKISMVQNDPVASDSDKAQRLDELRKEKDDLERQLDIAIGK